MPYVNLPPGNRGLQMEDGTHYRASREGGRLEVTSEHARAIDAMDGNGTAGLLTASFREYGGTSGTPGRLCCGRRWYAWSLTCPKCGAPTEPE